MRVSRKFLNVFLAAYILVSLLPAEALADFAPMPGGTGILGQVLDEKSGLPPENVTATLRYDDESSGVITVDEKKTVDADGKFQFTYHNEGGEFPAGDYTLTFTSPFYLTKVEQIHITDNAQGAIIQTYLTPGGSIFGTVTDAQTGAALDGVTVRSTSGGNAATTSEAGEYRLELEAGTHTIEFVKENYQTATLTRAFGPGTEAHIGADDVQLTLGSGGNVEIVASGDCSAYSRDNVTWSLDSAGQLTFSGTGNMGGYTTTVSNNTVIRCGAPWLEYRPQIKKVVIDEGITNISGYAFMSCFNLIDISIPDSVLTIGNGSFQGCTNLLSAYIPNSVNYLGSDAFTRCINLRAVTLPSSIDKINSGLFQEYSSLMSVNIPSAVISIEKSAFSGCSSL